MDSRAYTQANYIINEMSEEMRSKIPDYVIKNIESKMDKTYEFYVEESDLEDVELLEDTEKILSVIYTDYLASEEERKVILEKEKTIRLQKEKISREKYPIDFLKNKVSNTEKENKEPKQEMQVVKKETIIARILNKIKSLLGL